MILFDYYYFSSAWEIYLYRTYEIVVIFCKNYFK